MVFDDTFGEVEAWDAVAVVAGFGVVCVGAVCAVGDGLDFLVVKTRILWLDGEGTGNYSLSDHR